MELKQLTDEIIKMQSVTFNRTFMELKQREDIEKDNKRIAAFNRTFMELKPAITRYGAGDRAGF